MCAEDKEHCEEYGRLLSADPSKVTKRAKKRGLPQLGTLGAGNHYAEIQVVDEIFDKWVDEPPPTPPPPPAPLALCPARTLHRRAAASRMGIEEVGQVCVMIHSGSRGLGHQVATDALVEMERCVRAPPPFPWHSASVMCTPQSHGSRRHRNERPPAGLRPHRERRGADLPSCNGCRSQLCVGQPVIDDLSCAAGECSVLAIARVGGACQHTCPA